MSPSDAVSGLRRAPGRAWPGRAPRNEERLRNSALLAQSRASDHFLSGLCRRGPAGGGVGPHGLCLEAEPLVRPERVGTVRACCQEGEASPVLSSPSSAPAAGQRGLVCPGLVVTWPACEKARHCHSATSSRPPHFCGAVTFLVTSVPRSSLEGRPWVSGPLAGLPGPVRGHPHLIPDRRLVRRARSG